MRCKVGLLAFVGLLLLAACSSPSAQTPAESMSLSGVVGQAGGQLTLGALSVDASAARVLVDGEEATSQALQPGVVVSGSGERSADRIRLREVEVQYRVRGVVDMVDATQGSLEVLGLKVQVNAMTYLYEENPDDTYTRLTLADLQPGDYVKVAGVPQDNDTIMATRIERKPMLSTDPAYSRVSLRVRVRDLNTTTFTFSYGLRTYTVNYATALVQGVLSEGALVEIKGTRNGSTIHASKVRVYEMIKPGTKLELSGPLTNLDETTQTFRLMEYTVNYTGARVKGTLREGAWVKVEGSLSNGLLMAYEVEVKYSHSGSGSYTGEVEGPLSAVDTAALTLQVGNQTFWADANTLVKLHDAQGQFSDLRAGDWVEVKFDSNRANSAGQAYAVKIEAKRYTAMPNRPAELEGTLTHFNVSARTFQVNGVQVSVTPSTRYEIYDRLVTSEDFFGTDRTGARVEVKGFLTSSGLEASKVEIKKK